jgi:hypothetical protein
MAAPFNRMAPPDALWFAPFASSAYCRNVRQTEISKTEVTFRAVVTTIGFRSRRPHSVMPPLTVRFPQPLRDTVATVQNARRAAHLHRRSIVQGALDEAASCATVSTADMRPISAPAVRSAPGAPPPSGKQPIRASIRGWTIAPPDEGPRLIGALQRTSLHRQTVTCFGCPVTPGWRDLVDFNG